MCHNTRGTRGSDPVSTGANARMESTWPGAHRRDGDPQPPQFRAFAPPRISIAIPPLERARSGEQRGWLMQMGGSNGAATARTPAWTLRTCVHTNMCICARVIHTRDCIYAESYLPRLKSHRGREEIPWQRCLGNSLRSRSHSTPLRSLPLSLSFCPSLVPLLRLSAAVHRAAVCRCIVSIFTQGRRAGGGAAFIISSFFLRRRTPCRAGRKR